MTIIEVLEHVRELLRSKGRVSYRLLTTQFQLSSEELAALTDELIAAERVAIDEDGKVLVWVGGAGTGEPENRRTGVAPPSPQSPAPNTQLPSSYTPPHLAERIRAEQAAFEARGATDGERKTITALFADLKGSTALIEGLDPEEARAIIDPALQLMMDAVHRYEGYVAQALGDGIFALFGAPLAHEDHSQRALYAALRMQEEMRRYSDQVRLNGGPPLQMRVGINTGEVVVRSIRKDDLHTDYVPVGHATNLAARMEQMATPGSILITAHTQKLTEGYFDLKALGAAAIKGVEEPLHVYEVVGVGPLRTRLQVAVGRGLTRFVGRYPEMAQLRRALDQAKAGHGQLIGVMGEPGLGKSRLLYEFKLTSPSGCLVLEAYSVSHGKAAPYLPVIELLKNYFQIQLQDDERTRREKVLGKVLGLDRSLEDTLPYLFALLGTEEKNSSLQQMDPQIRRRRTFAALKKLFLRESLNQPLILIFEDLHWIDTETQGFLDTLSESIASAKVLLLVNYRPEYRHEWGQKTDYTQLRLAPLGKAEAKEFLDALLGTTGEATGRSPLHPLKQLILAKTEGTPFFMEEVVQTLMEEGVLRREAGVGWVAPHPTTALHLPTTVQGVLAARIDRLAADEKALLQQFAVIGREFSLSLAKQVISQPEDELYRLLSSLQRKEFLYEQPAFPEVEYLFKHALTQEVAYNSVLQERRKPLHERTAEAIERLYSANLEEHYSDLAHHYTRSGNAQKAIEYLQKAGQQAVQRSANEEAIRQLTAALRLLETLADTAERQRQELTLQLSLGTPLQALRGWSAPEVEHVYNRARELCQHGGDPAQLMQVLWGLAAFYLVRGNLKTADEIAEQAISTAHSIEDPTLSLVAHYAKSLTLFSLGEVVAARVHCEQGLAFYDPQLHHSLVSQYLDDPGMGCQGSLAFYTCVLGYLDQGSQQSRTALALARTLSHPFSLNTALMLAAWVCDYRREWQAFGEQIDAALAIAEEQGFGFREAWSRVWRGRALAEQGQLEEGIAQMRQGLAALRVIGAEWMRPHSLALLAEAYGKVGQLEEGLTVIAEALTIVDNTGERSYEAELYRLKGTLTLKQSGVRSPASAVPNTQHPTPSPQAEAEAEACFLPAIDIARLPQAKSPVVRAATSLARLWQQQGKTTEAHQMLVEIYSWFTEGFDTRDLQEAKALLEALT